MGVGVASFGGTGAWLHRCLVWDRLHERLRSARHGGLASSSFGVGASAALVTRGRGFIIVCVGATPLLLGVGSALFGVGVALFGNTGAWRHRCLVGDLRRLCLATRGRGFIVFFVGAGPLLFGVGAHLFGVREALFGETCSVRGVIVMIGGMVGDGDHLFLG